MGCIETVKRFINCHTNICQSLFANEGHRNENLTCLFVKIALENGPENTGVGWQRHVYATDAVEPASEVAKPSLGTSQTLRLRVRAFGGVNFRMAGIDFRSNWEKRIGVHEIFVLIAQSDR